MSLFDIDLSTLPWARWNLSRCSARLDKHDPAPIGDTHYGRCELKSGHHCPHALDRGMEVVLWNPTMITRVGGS